MSPVDAVGACEARHDMEMTVERWMINMVAKAMIVMMRVSQQQDRGF